MADLGFSTISDIFSSLNSKGDVSIAYKTLANLFGKLASDDPVAYPERWGASSTASAKQNLTALNKAYNYLYNLGGGTIQFRGYGPYNFGTLRVDDFGMVSGLNIVSDNIRICGVSGRHKTELRFSSAGINIGGLGCALVYINQQSSGLPVVSAGIDQIHFENLIIRDINPVDPLHSHAGDPGNPSMIAGIVLKNASCRHMTLYNGIGNGAITILGDANSPYVAGSGSLMLEDIWCYADNIAAGLYQEGDWINVSEFNDITCLGIHVPFGGQNRLCMEFGTGIGDLLIADCNLCISANGVIGTTAIGSVSTVRSFTCCNNIIKNWVPGQQGLIAQPDVPSGSPFPLKNVNIHHNDFSSIYPTGGPAIVYETPADTDILRIEHNFFIDCIAPIYLDIDALPPIYTGINYNRAPKAKVLFFSNANGGGNLGPDFQNTTSIFECVGNTLLGAQPGDFCKTVDLSLWKKLKNKQFKIHHNKANFNHESNGQIDGQSLVQFVLGALVANGADTPTFTTTIIGVKPNGGDIVHITYSVVNTPPAGVFFHGVVTADDTITYYGRNLSGANLPAGTYGITMQIERT